MAEFSEAPSRRQRDDNGDRISQLPDVLLLQILSLLSTKQAVATGILSKRWRPLWPSVSLLDFDDESSSESRGGTGFSGFVNSVLLRHDAPTVELFRLRCANPDSSREVPTWLCHVVRRGVEHVEVLLSLSRYVALPRSLFNCNTLTVLKLDGVFLNTLSSFSVNLPALRVLHVGDRVLFGCHDYVVKLLARCPVLEDLVLQSTYKDACGGVFCTDGNIVLNLNHLERAKLGFSWKERCFKSMVLVFQALYNVSYLSLSDTAVGCLKDAFVRDIPVFDNLIQLEFSYSSYSWNLLSRILQGSHKLEVLMVYKETQKYTKGPESRWNHLPLIPECILLHLKTFCFREYQGMEDELDFVGYIMQNARVLETIIIYISTSLRFEVQLQLRRNLSALQRNYGTREIEFH